MEYKMKLHRKRIYEIVELSHENDILSKAYDIWMVFIIILSIIPLCFVENGYILTLIDNVTTFIFITDYLLRFVTADFSSAKKGILAFIIYPFRFLAIIDLLSILPSLTNLNKAFKIFKTFRLLKTFRVFKIFRYSKNIQIIKTVLITKKDDLLIVGVLSLTYIFISALIVFQVEPETFGDFFKAIYWSTISLTTVGYGDIYPISNIGKVISMISSFLGIAIVALPSGIIISGYQEALHDYTKSETE